MHAYFISQQNWLGNYKNCQIKASSKREAPEASAALVIRVVISFRGARARAATDALKARYSVFAKTPYPVKWQPFGLCARGATCSAHTYVCAREESFCIIQPPRAALSVNFKRFMKF